MKYFKFKKKLVMNIMIFSLLMSVLLVPHKVMASQEQDALIYEEMQENIASERGENETDWDIFDSEATTTTIQTTTATPESTTAHQHIYEEAIIKNPTCKETGIRSYSCTVEGCNSSYTEKIPVINHKIETRNVIKASCAQKGYTGDKVCMVCGTILEKGNSIPMLEHTIVKDKAVQPTCTQLGRTEGSHCSVCNIILKEQKVIKATGHTYQTQITKATTEKDGKEIKKCSICKKIQSTKTISRPKKITLSTTTYTYTGKEKKPSVKIFDANGNEISSSNYTIIYPSGRKNVGTYKMTVIFRGNKYQGSLSKSFKINQAAQVVRGSNYTKTLGDSAFSLNIKQEKGTGVLSYKSSNKTIADVSSKGKVTLKGVGMTNITVTAAETKNYKKTSYKLKVTVKPKAIKLKTITNIKAGKMIVNWEKSTKVTGYELQYSTKSNFSSMQKNTITSYKTTNKTISKLKKGKKYYVRVRCYQTIKGKKYYSNWSNIKSITIKK